MGRACRPGWPSLKGIAALLMVAACAQTSPERPPATSPAGPATSGAQETSTTAAGLTTTSVTTTSQATTGPAVVIARGDPARRSVALTFDAGSDVGFASRILDILADARVPATFGLTGKWAEENRSLVQRVAAEGHLIVNHTYDHRSFTGVSAKPAVASATERRDQLDRTDAIVSALTGRSTRPWFRPPYGDYDNSVNADVGAAGYRYNLLWTVDSLGWQGLSPEAITSRCLERAEPGAIYLFHVGAASQDAAALPEVIAGLRQRGYSFGTAADLVPG